MVEAQIAFSPSITHANVSLYRLCRPRLGVNPLGGLASFGPSNLLHSVALHRQGVPLLRQQELGRGARIHQLRNIFPGPTKGGLGRFLRRATEGDGDGGGRKNTEGGGELNTDLTAQKEQSDKGSPSAVLGDVPGKEMDTDNLQEDLEKERKKSEFLKRVLDEADKKVKEQETLLEGGRGAGGGLSGGGDFFSSISATLREAVDSLETALGLKVVDMPVMEKLDLSVIRKVCSQYSATSFYMTDIRRYGTGAMVVGNLRCSTEVESPKACLDDVAESTRKRLTEALGVELGVWFLVDSSTEQTVLVVQPLAEVTARLDSARLKGIRRWPLSVTLMVLTCFTITSVSGVNLDPNGAQRDIFTSVFPLAGGLWAVLGVGEIFQRIMAKRYGVKLSPPFLIPSNWLGCLGIATRIESFIPSKAALFDIAAARAVGGWIAALTLTISAFLLDGGVNGGSNPLYVEPTFFQPNLLLSFIQYVIGPYSDELGNVLPHAVPGLGVPVNPLAFAGLLGLVVTSLNLLPAGQLEGGRIIQALFGRKRAEQLTTITTTLLGLSGLFGSVLCLIWGFIIVVFRNGQELPALDEVSEVGRYRLVLGWFLLGGCILMLLPNSAGTFPSTFFTPPSFYGDF